jgi:serine/threonine protein phosphatase PrpC
MGMLAAVISERGRRMEMEDTHNLDTDFGGRGWVFGGVYDGHHGWFAADYTAGHLPQMFFSLVLSGASPAEAFRSCYETVSSLLAVQSSGTTAFNFFIKEGVIHTANAGDARALVISRNSFTQLTTDHRVNNPEERKRIEAAHGVIEGIYVVRNGEGLMPTRTIGDAFFKPAGVISLPATSEHKISPEDIFLIAACDGLYDTLNNEEVAEIAQRGADVEALVNALKNEVLDRGGGDNITIIAVALGTLIAI